MDADESKRKRNFSVHAVHLIRTTQQINVALSQMADQKASILMGGTFVVFTISIGQVRAGGFALPLMVLAFFSFISAMLAVYAVLPATGTPPAEDRNILFFGTFTTMSEQEFADAVIDRLEDEETLFRTMLRDIYQNGQVLQRKKYRFLGLAYRAFLLGLVLTIISFMVTYLGYGPMM
nr:Pycsar system effector family protein [Sphingomonas sanxanigenens]